MMGTVETNSVKVTASELSNKIDGATRYSATVIVKTDRGVGFRADVAQEVVHMSLAVDGDEIAGIKYSDGSNTPWAYHSSRDGGLRMARDLMNSGQLAACGFEGCAQQLMIPGIPCDQQQDAGLHMSIYNRPWNAHQGVDYQPPDLEKALALAGTQMEFGVEGGVTILNASEANDLKTGVCYYVSISCDQRATDKANEIQSEVGLPVDVTQKFHLTLAGLGPSWIQCHPKSAFATSADQQEHLESELAKGYKVMRHGDAEFDFEGFNDNLNTGWTTHAETCSKGFCKPVGPKESIKCIATPSLLSQQRVLEHYKATFLNRKPLS
jgi:hypothetical protein